MGFTRWLSIAVAVCGTVLGSLPRVASAAQPTHADSPICQQNLPAASDGHLTIDRVAVRPGGSAIAVLSGFRQWPVRLIGGGSGETFLSCLPGQSSERAEVLVHDAAALFLVPIPSGTKPGSYPLSVVYYQGSTGASSGGTEVRLSAHIQVRADADDVTTASPVCRLKHGVASAGRLNAPAAAMAGTPLTASIQGLASGPPGYLDEYDRLAYVACLAGNATPVAGVSSSGAPMTLRVPAGLPDGDYELAVTGQRDGSVVTWTERIHISRPAMTSSSSGAATPSVTPSVTASSTPNSSASASTATRPTTPAQSSAAETTSARPSPSPAGDTNSPLNSGLWTVGSILAALAAAGFAFAALRRGRGNR